MVVHLFISAVWRMMCVVFFVCFTKSVLLLDSKALDFQIMPAEK